MAVGSIYELKVRSSAPEAQMVNVLHYVQVTAVAEPESATVDALLAAADAAFSQEFVDVMPNTYVLTDFSANRIIPLPRTLDQQVIISSAGARAVTPLPAECCVVLTKRTAFAGRGYRGRIYLSGLAQSDTANGLIIAGAYATALAALATKLDNTLASNGNVRTWDPVIYRRATAQYTPIQSVVVRPTVRAQRRRQAGVGI